MALHLVQVFTAELLKILIFKYSQSEENMYDCLLLDVIRLPSLYLQKFSNISITFHFLENFLQCYMYLQQRSAREIYIYIRLQIAWND